MTQWNNLTQTQRFSKWKQFRSDLNYIEDNNDLINAVAKFFSDMPQGPRAVDYYTPNSWPTPWEILHEGNFCVNAISLLMYHTLDMTPTFTGDIKLVLIEDDDTFIVPIIDNEYLLNYHIGEPARQTIVATKIVDTYTADTIKTFA